MADILEPGVIIRPQLSQATAKELVRKLYGFQVKTIKELDSYDDRNFYVTVEAEHRNPNVNQLWPHGFVLKILNSMDSPKKHVEAEHAAMQILRENKVQCPAPVLNLQGQDKSLEKIFPENAQDGDAEEKFKIHMVRLLTFQPGKTFVQVPYTPELLYGAGKSIGQINRVWMGFSHPALTSHTTIWSLGKVPDLKLFLHAVTNKEDVALIEEIMDAFSSQVLNKLDKFKKGIIHGDYNEQNILVNAPEGSSDYSVSGVIDFGDLQETYYVFELAIVMMYMSVESRIVDPMLAGGHVLAGYLTEMELNEEEFDVLKVCVAGRYAQSLVMGAYSYSQDPGNEYLLVTAKRGWPQIHELWKTPKEQLYEQWKDVIAGYKK